MKNKTPAYYVAPLKSRAAICAALLTRAEDNSRPGYGMFCFNVKCYGLDLSFDHLAQVAKDAGVLESDSPRYLAECRERLEGSSELENWAIESARDSVMDADGYRMLWDGAAPVAEWEFAGRSGGWLALKTFDGVNLAGMDRHEFEAFIEPDGASFSWLRNLYRFLVQCDHDFRREAVKSEIEHCAAFTFFANVCSDVESDKQAEGREARAVWEAGERAHWEARDLVTIPA